MSLLRSLALASFVGLAVSCAGAANATVYGWDFSPTLSQHNPNAGTIQNVQSTFDSATKRLTFNATFAPVPGGSSLVTNGFWLVLNDGPNPKGHAGELAIMYFDASSFAAPKLTVYNYNGVNGPNSWADGNGSGPGTPPGDFIQSSTSESSWILSAKDVVIGGQTRRQMSFDIDATDIVNHTPLYPGSSPWFGTGFDDKLGVWFHPVRSLSASYAADGRFNSVQFGQDGWLDGENFKTTVIPAPGSAALLGLGGLALARRRRS